MKKYIPFFAIALIFFTLSCSNNTQQQSSLNFSISKNLIRTITNESSSDLSLKISISGDTVTEKSFSIQKDSISDETQSFTVENLTAGQTILVDVSVFCGTIQYYKTKETKTLTLVEGNNSVDIVLTSVLGNSDISITDKSNFSISAVDEKENSYYYSSSSSDIPEISYLIETTFSLNSDSTFLSYTWYLNGEELECPENNISLTLSKSDYVNIDGINSIVCFFSDENSSYEAEFKFTIKDK